ncbi:tRNA modification GTPase MnmE [Porphyromonas macacae]|uniref:tRNA modification GTPase MnmE n=1 Tax=Porphyromonas macacae TaxID=28115 RepID=A0A379DKW6_9PORP|nr:tRNA uridine-5-carboxymethylaminomethyl(34) synthesis GTPase MnmE [Porphyromonas macacae]SUB78627.1 tRNA modification GTPase MnmE [Porphyromonas macacae]
MTGNINSDTICATATAAGMGGIAVIRISGPEALTYTLPYLKKRGKPIELPDRQAVFCTFNSSGGDMLDEVVATAFHAPHSYTGENVIEISCHASTYIEQNILQTLIASGCRLAEPGEFTQRAYLNGKMDLSQAEAVADLIASESRAQHRMAMQQMRGSFSNELNGLRDKLLHFTSLMELELDFSEEDVTFANRDELLTFAKDIVDRINRLEQSFRLGNAIKKGIPVAIVGPTNAGKSTLLNRLVGEEKAIVSNIHGTTRDVIEDTVVIDGVLYRFIDTAGLRHTEDVVESMGIERSFKKLKEAAIVLVILDITEVIKNGLPAVYLDVIEHLVPEQRLITVFNKIDLADEDRIACFNESVLKNGSVAYVSASKDRQMDYLRSEIAKAAALPSVAEGDIVISNARHHALLLKANRSLNQVIQGLTNGLSGDLLAQDLREAIHLLGEITGGEITSENILHNIFKHFCIGK